MPTQTVDDYERAFLLQTLGGLAVPKDTIQDLRFKFYKGVVEGSIVLGGGGGATVAALGTVPAVGKWFTDPLIANFQDDKSIWYVDSYMYLPASITVDRCSYNVTNTTSPGGSTIVVTAYPVNSDGSINTGAPIGATGAIDVSTTGVKDNIVNWTLPAGNVAFRMSGTGAVSATKVKSKRRVGTGANIASSPQWGSEPYPIDSNTANSLWEPMLYFRRSA